MVDAWLGGGHLTQNCQYALRRPQRGATARWRRAGYPTLGRGRDNPSGGFKINFRAYLVICWLYPHPVTRGRVGCVRANGGTCCLPLPLISSRERRKVHALAKRALPPAATGVARFFAGGIHRCFGNFTGIASGSLCRYAPGLGLRLGLDRNFFLGGHGNRGFCE